MRTKSSPFKFTSIALAMLVFLSSLGLTVGVHFCQDNIKGLKLFAKANTCVSMEDGGQCETETSFTGNHISKKECCTDASISAKASFLSNQFASFQTSFEILGITQIFTQATRIIQFVEESIQFDHGPPNLIWNASFRILLQTFLL